MKTTINKSILYILLFYVIALLLRYYLVVIQPEFYVNATENIQSLLSGISPLIAGLLLVFGFKRPNELKFFELGYLKTFLILAFPIIVFFGIKYFNVAEFNLSIITTVSVAIIYAIFEEYGWRGFLQTELKFLNKYYKYFIISILWYIWHLDFGLDLNHLFSYFYVLLGSFGIGYVADKSKSLILPAMFHMFYNVIFASSFDGISLNQRLIVISLSIIVSIFLMRLHLRRKR